MDAGVRGCPPAPTSAKTARPSAPLEASIRWPWLTVLTWVPFGLAHLYQGAEGWLSSPSLGILCWVTLATGTLLPGMVIHATVDLRNLAIAGQRAVRAAAGQGLLPGVTTSGGPT